MKIGIPVKCQNGHAAVWIVEISGLEHHHKGVPEADKCKCPKHDFGMGYSAYDKPFVIGDDVVEALRKDAERYRWLMSDSVLNGTLGICGGWIDFGFKDEAAQQIEEAMSEAAKP